jgi:DNA-binding PucR family transcriptional regulator
LSAARPSREHGTRDSQLSALRGLLFGMLSSRPQELRLLYRDTVAPLVGYDERYHTELVATLKTYLSENCNMNATANTMLAHRHTIAYRLDRIRELTGLDPGRSEDREWLALGLKACHLIRLNDPACGEARLDRVS